MFSIYQWIGNCILPQFDPKINSLGLLEAKINLKQRTMGDYCNGCYLCGDGSGLGVDGGGLWVCGGSVGGGGGGGAKNFLDRKKV